MLVIICQLGSLFGFFRLNMMERTVSSGIIMAAIFTMVFQMLGDLSWSLVAKQFVPLLSASCRHIPSDCVPCLKQNPRENSRGFFIK